jgi:hypothetical protein
MYIKYHGYVKDKNHPKWDGKPVFIVMQHSGPAVVVLMDHEQGLEGQVVLLSSAWLSMPTEKLAHPSLQSNARIFGKFEASTIKGDKQVPDQDWGMTLGPDVGILEVFSGEAIHFCPECTTDVEVALPSPLDNAVFVCPKCFVQLEEYRRVQPILDNDNGDNP